jgi:hypothetical protein
MDDLQVKRCKACNKPNRQQCARCSGKGDPNAARNRLLKDEKATGVTTPRLATLRENARTSYKSQNEDAQSHGFHYRMCRGPNGTTGLTCKNCYSSAFSGKGVFLCAKCHKALKGAVAHAEVLAKCAAEHAVKLPSCKGINGNGKACRNHLRGKNGILGALRRAGIPIAAARDFMQNDIPDIVHWFDQSKLCLACFKKVNPQHAQDLTAITKCSVTDSGGVPCERVAIRNGLCGSHADATERCAGISGDFKCESGMPPSRKKNRLCRPCFEATVAQVLAATSPLRRPPRKKQKLDSG